MDKLRIQDERNEATEPSTMTSWDILEEEIRPLYTDFLLKRNVEMQKINEI